jgi:hypothetical protein
MALDWPDGPRGIDAADIGDGDVDFVFVERPPTIFWYANNGTERPGVGVVGSGSFTDAPRCAPRSHGDGDADIAASSRRRRLRLKNGG